MRLWPDKSSHRTCDPKRAKFCAQSCFFRSGRLTVRRVDSQVDGDVGDAFVRARHAVRLILDLLTYHVEVREHAALAVQELRIFCRHEQNWQITKDRNQLGILFCFPCLKLRKFTPSRCNQEKTVFWCQRNQESINNTKLWQLAICRPARDVTRPAH